MRPRVRRCRAAVSSCPYLRLGSGGKDWSRTEGFEEGSSSMRRVWPSSGDFTEWLPDITVGHSLGRRSAAYVAGTIGLSDAVGLVGARAAVVDRLTGRYAMAVLGVERRRGPGGDRRNTGLAGSFGGEWAVVHGGVR